MLEILQGSAYTLSLLFFWSGAIYFDLKVRRIKQEIEAQKKFQELLKNKEFIKEYLETMKATEENDNV
tara:strand:- start:2821 stop:3024 length:204 start_codon:yes stop_codon:yes gene_type:complete